MLKCNRKKAWGCSVRSYGNVSITDRNVILPPIFDKWKKVTSSSPVGCTVERFWELAKGAVCVKPSVLLSGLLKKTTFLNRRVFRNCMWCTFTQHLHVLSCGTGLSVWPIRSGRFGLETFRSDYEILQKYYINAKYLNQWQVFFEHTLVNVQAKKNWGIWECYSREIWHARRKFFAAIL